MMITCDAKSFQPLRSVRIFLLSCILIWYVCNGAYSMSLTRQDGEYHNIDFIINLIWTIYLVGWVSALLSIVVFNTFHQSSQHVQGFWIFTSFRASLLPIGTHWIGNTFTVLAFLVGSIASVQVFKSFGPFFTTMFSMCFEKNDFPKRAIIPLFTLCIGIALSTWKNSNFSAQALMLCLTSGIALPLRNVLVKKLNTTSNNKEHNFLRASRISFSVNLGAWLLTTAICLLLSASYPSINTKLSWHMVEIGFFRTFYEIASLLTLLQVDAVIHGALDVSKRAIVTVLDLFCLTNTLPNPLNVFGSITALGSLFWFKYVLTGQETKSIQINDRTRTLIAVILIVLLLVISSSALVMFSHVLLLSHHTINEVNDLVKSR